MTETHQAATAEAMIEIGRAFASTLEPGSVIALEGDLGAGKTHFCKGVAEGLGAAEEVTSPTFALVQEYRSGRLPVFHFDWYRIESETELIRLGWDDYLDEAGVALVEWAAKFPSLLPADAIRIGFAIQPEGTRTLTVHRP